jgi:hypothetical protein
MQARLLGQAEIGTWVHPRASHCLASVTTNGLGSYIWGTVGSGITSHPWWWRLRWSSKHFLLFIWCGWSPEKILLNPVTAKASDRTLSSIMLIHPGNICVLICPPPFSHKVKTVIVLSCSCFFSFHLSCQTPHGGKGPYSNMGRVAESPTCLTVFTLIFGC